MSVNWLPLICWSAAGWVLQPKPGTPFWEVYYLFNIHDLKLDGIYWKAAAYQVPKARTSGLQPSQCDIKEYYKDFRAGCVWHRLWNAGMATEKI